MNESNSSHFTYFKFPFLIHSKPYHRDTFFRRPFITSLSHVYLSHSCLRGRHCFDNPGYVYYSLARTLGTIHDMELLRPCASEASQICIEL